MSKVIPIIVDVESDGPCPGLYSMVCFGAVAVVNRSLDKTFYAQTAPISQNYIPDALAISGFSRDQHLSFSDPTSVMISFQHWLTSLKTDPKDSLSFISDNPAFDWQFINYYFHSYRGTNPFGYSARRIGDIYAGLKGYAYAKWKHLRKTIHNHDPLSDAKGNAEALIYMIDNMGLRGYHLE